MYRTNARVHFQLFRYQILPTTQQQRELFREVPTVEDLKKRKNEIFENVLACFPDLRYRQAPLNFRVDLHAPPWFVVEINTQKNLQRERKDFEKEKIDTWPYVIVIINNDPSVQLIAISRNTKAFYTSEVVAKILRNNFQRILRQHHLNIQVETLFEKNQFWDLVKEFQGRIASVKFELISPNMSNISKALTLDLAKINADTNSHRTDIKLNSGKGSVLEINHRNELVNGLVEYSSEGGGDIEIRIKGLRKKVRTSEGAREITIDKVTAKNLTPERLAQVFDKL